jgi:outer membrane protein OmpA-like peptidoglycan-associated protein
LAPAAPAAPAAPTRLAEATPPPPAAQPAPPRAAPNALPKGADRLTLPFFVDESDLAPAENAMVRDFAGRSGGAAQYVIRAFATAPAGDDDPSTPRRIALARAQSVAAALMASGIQSDRLRLLALGNAGGAPADRVEVIAMPPSSGHTPSESTP